ncbi:hypothetical protein [Notoacmeibacter marinus]|uniref:hypothetical protein n=1 Tax=Notoacmeibacter marinus TaxID=1876515 RepID=UPI000DF49A24|nr:hypothetical protein [Notoacmeibacter marinus]
MSGVTLNDLFLAAFSGQPRNHQRLGREARRYARAISLRRAPDLPEDLHEEVFTEAFAQLWDMPSRMTGDQTPVELYRKAVLAAIRAVRASYAPPGQRTRPKKSHPQPKIAAEDVGRIPDAVAIETASIGQGIERVIDLDRLPCPRASRVVDQYEHRCEARYMLARAPAPVAAALRLIYLDDEPVGEVARSLAISRFALSRRIAAFAAEWRTAA